MELKKNAEIAAFTNEKSICGGYQSKKITNIVFNIQEPIKRYFRVKLSEENTSITLHI